MKTTVTVTPNEAKKEESKYPYYGQEIGGDMIVFFISENEGVAISSNLYRQGVMGNWPQNKFAPIIGTITIIQES